MTTKMIAAELLVLADNIVYEIKAIDETEDIPDMALTTLGAVIKLAIRVIEEECAGAS